jgi:hypothetical protein
MSFYKGLWGGHVRLGQEHAPFAWAHPEPVQKLPHLRRLAGNPREDFDSGRHFRHGGRRMLAKLGFDRRPVSMQGTARPTRLAVFQLLDPAGAIGVEITMEARFGHPTQSRDIAIGNPLTAQLEGCHAHLDARRRMLVPPRVSGFDVSFVTYVLDHLATTDARVGLCLTSPTLPYRAQKSQ